MKQVFNGWSKVADRLHTLANDRTIQLNDGQAASMRELAKRLPFNGVIIADEVGMGKTRIAAAVAQSVIAEGGRVAILVPSGLGYQWSEELRNAEVDAPPILRSLWQYLQVWETAGEWGPWFEESALVISHSFTNWRLGENTAPWRWTLLPEIYARWRKYSYGRWPRDYLHNKILGDKRIEQAAESIVDAIGVSREGHPARCFIDEMAEKTPWPGALDPFDYGRTAYLRPWLERAVGLGLGLFDLVIVDEAHKSRGDNSGLNRLLNDVVLQTSSTRRLAMTATPVELDGSQWTQMLSRIKLNEISKASATKAIDEYGQAVDSVRRCPSDKKAREDYKESAKAFKSALDPYLLRRDKRQDPAVKQFQMHSSDGIGSYRREQEILIDTAQLTVEWKRAVCAVEALSFATRQSDQTAAKRLRLTIGNGHGIAALLDQLDKHDEDDLEQTTTGEVSSIVTQHGADEDLSINKRLQRTQWWQHVLIQPFDNEGSAMFDHPAILAAVEEIERVTGQGEKVLVFGRFTRPLRALTQLLNAREMLRCIDSKRPWPQSKVHEDRVNVVNDEWCSVVAAHRQLKRPGELKRENVDAILKKQYEDIESQREKFRRTLISHIEDGLNTERTNSRIQVLFDVFKKEVETDSQRGNTQGDYGIGSLLIVARAIHELLGFHIENATSSEFTQAFINLVRAASDRDEDDGNDDGQLDEIEATQRWIDLKTRLFEEYCRPEGGFARLMYGKTKPATRRFLQLAFNRKQGNPKVLVAQSSVGREGLNLHKACRTVVLLHPEWNPGVVEQQIGRLDRIGSLWEVELNEAIAEKKTDEGLPRIDIRPVVFQGTYDEKNWQVLQGRWDDLRAQLHGIVISPRIAKKYSNADDMIAEINSAAPDFSPI